MTDESNYLSRRELLAGIALAGPVLKAAPAEGSLFDGKTLDGWIQIENSATSLASGGIIDPAGFAGKLTNGSDAVSVFLRGRLLDSKAVVKDLNRVIAGPSIYDKERFSGIVLRAETVQLLRQNPSGQQLARLNKLLLEDAYTVELAKSVTTGWVVK